MSSLLIPAQGSSLFEGNISVTVGAIISSKKCKLGSESLNREVSFALNEWSYDVGDVSD